MKRHRGVIASRIRLYKALNDSGLESQAALAERMADLEGLDAAPKDLVSRVFREVAVDPRSIERVARALGVESFELYKRSEEPDAEAGHAAETAPRPQAAAAAPMSRPASRPMWPAAAAGLAVIAALVYVGLRNAGDGDTAAPPVASEHTLATTKIALLAAPDDSALGDFAAAARLQLAQRMRVPSPGAPLALATLDPAQALQTLNLDYALRAEAQTVGRRIGLRVTLFQPGASRDIWAESFVRPWRAREHETFAANLGAALAAAITEGSTPTFPTAEAQRDYLHGMDLLDRSRDELTVKRALTRLQSALRRSPRYPAARAGLCRGLYEQSRLAGEARFLEEAEQECAQALEVEPEMSEARFSLAQIMRKSGRLEAAVDTYRAVIAHDASHVDARVGLAEANLATFVSGSEPAAIDTALAYAQQAAALDPQYWKAPYTIGRIEFFRRNMHAAVEAYERARAIDDNPYVLSNLGTMYFCMGEYARAAALYLTVQGAAPHLYVGDAQLGVVYLYQGEHDKAVDHLGRAVSTLAAGAQVEEHRLWANYADALRHHGDADAALEAYEKAAALTERLYSQAPDDPNLTGFLGNYYAEIAVLDAEHQSPRVREVAIEQLTRAAEATDMEALSRIAQGWARLGRIAETRAALAKLEGQCDGAWGSPDFAALREDPAVEKRPRP